MSCIILVYECSDWIFSYDLPVNEKWSSKYFVKVLIFMYILVWAILYIL